MRSLEPRRSVINRIPDGTMRDNTYALSSPRDVVSLFLSLEDAENLGMVWTASISQVAEDHNQTAVKNLRGHQIRYYESLKRIARCYRALAFIGCKPRGLHSKPIAPPTCLRASYPVPATSSPS